MPPRTLSLLAYLPLATLGLGCVTPGGPPTTGSGTPGAWSSAAAPAAHVSAAPAACLAPGARPDTLGADGESIAGGVVSFRGALNGDSFEDLLVRYPESCSGYGECEHAAYFGCGDARFVRVYGPEYSVELSVQSSSVNGARTLEEVRRTDSAEDPGATRAVLRYDGTRYVGP